MFPPYYINPLMIFFQGQQPPVMTVTPRLDKVSEDDFIVIAAYYHYYANWSYLDGAYTNTSQP